MLDHLNAGISCANSKNLEAILKFVAKSLNSGCTGNSKSTYLLFIEIRIQWQDPK